MIMSSLPVLVAAFLAPKMRDCVAASTKPNLFHAIIVALAVAHAAIAFGHGCSCLRTFLSARTHSGDPTHARLGGNLRLKDCGGYPSHNTRDDGTKSGCGSFNAWCTRVTMTFIHDNFGEVEVSTQRKRTVKDAFTELIDKLYRDGLAKNTASSLKDAVNVHQPSGFSPEEFLQRWTLWENERYVHRTQILLCDTQVYLHRVHHGGLFHGALNTTRPVGSMWPLHTFSREDGWESMAGASTLFDRAHHIVSRPWFFLEAPTVCCALLMTHCRGF